MQQRQQLLTKFFLSFFSLFLLINFSRGQTSENLRLLRQKIETADSVLLISHEVTYEFAVKEEPNWNKRDTTMNLKKWNELHPLPPKFWLNGKLNRQIISESYLLADSSKQTFMNILLREVNINKVTPSKCDEPRHSIIIYNGNKQSYIDLCFGCEQIHTSKDIDFSLFDMDETKWSELKIFYKAHGITKVFKEFSE